MSTASIPEPPSGWGVGAPCEGATGQFYPDEDENEDYPDLAWSTICSGCPVRLDCLAEALRNGERWGAWGGFTPRARENLAMLLDAGVVTWAMVESALSASEGVLHWKDDRHP